MRWQGGFRATSDRSRTRQEQAVIQDEVNLWNRIILSAPLEIECRIPNDCLMAASRSVPYMAYIAHAVTGVWCGEVGICDARVYTVCV